MERIIYEYVYYFHKGYTFKKQICINNNKKIIFNFIVNDLFCDDLLMCSISKDFKDNTLNIKVKDYLISVIYDNIKLKTLGLCLKGIKCNVEIIKNGIKINDKVFRLKNSDYDKLESETLKYIESLKHQ